MTTYSRCIPKFIGPDLSPILFLIVSRVQSPNIMLGNLDDRMGKECKLFVKLEQPLASGLKKAVWIELPTNF